MIMLFFIALHSRVLRFRALQTIKICEWVWEAPYHVKYAWLYRCNFSLVLKIDTFSLFCMNIGSTFHRVGVIIRL